ncbi:MAG: efflux RND transporter periplasmic adaptor subunit [Bacteroidales bacterium]|jgi:RND family efflux transporter MFP subunit|nr:efflux RND transporter periplasmic adaptor subunit [Bacteroidales bacterium]
MKRYLIALSGLLLMACSGSKEPAEKSTDKVEVTEHKKIRVKELAKEDFSHFIEVNGTINAIEIANISPEMNGQIREIPVKEGQWVEKGTLLMKLNTRAIESSLKEVESGLELATVLYQKQKDLWDQKIGSEVQYLQAKNKMEGLQANKESLQAQLDMSHVYAPFNGIVDKINAKIGEMGGPTRPVIDFVNLNRMKVVADVSEKHLPSVKRGKKVEFTVPTYPDMSLELPVYRTGNIINPVNRTFEVEIRMNNIKNKLKPNMLAVLFINDKTINDALLVPSIIIKEDNTGKFLFKVNGNNVAEKIYVKTGISYKDQTEIVEGLNEGDKVVTEGYNLIANGDTVGIIQ